MTGTITSPNDLGEGDWRKTNPRFLPENFDHNKRLVDHLKQLAERKGCSVAQLALAWVISRGTDMFPIPGTKKMKYLLENIAATEISFTPEELSEIDRVAPAGIAFGDRYTAAGMQAVHR